VPAAEAPLCHIRMSDIRVTYLPDGIHHIRPHSQYDGGGADTWELHSQYLDSDGWLVMSLGSMLVETGDTKLLVDLGWGPRSVDIAELTGGMHEGDMIGGKMLSSLRRVGLTPDDIDLVVYSHLHPDHVGWACDNDSGAPTFPDALHVVGDIEWDYWHNGPEAGTLRAPTEMQLAAMERRLHLATDGEVVAPGVTLMWTPGHTPGHCSLVISSGDQKAVVLGDAVHCPIEVSEPELEFVFDVDRKLARKTRERIERELEAPETIAAGGHFPDLIFGRLMSSDAGRRLEFAQQQKVV
jgi:glyoxylase-like metal-dependent hydrolase (beta-lactamase superfamily II)